MLGSLFNKVASLKVCSFFKNRLQHRCFLWILQNCLRIAFLYNTSGGCFWHFYHGTVKSAGVPVLGFRASTCFRFWLKTFTKRWQIIIYYHVTKRFLACLNWFVTWIWFQNMFWKTLIAFDFDEILTQSVAQVTVISRVKIFFPLHFAVYQVLSISGFNFENGRIPCKQKYCIKNMAVNSDFVLLTFTLLT